MRKTNRFKLWLSRKLLDMIRPALFGDIDRLVEASLAERYGLTDSIRACIIGELNQRVPRESTTHSLACHVRDHATELERRIDKIDEFFFFNSRNGTKR